MEKITNPACLPDEREMEQKLRPAKFADFVGQEKSKANLQIFVQAAKMREEPLDHVLIYGPPGLGKTTLAVIIARELGSDLVMSSGPVLEKPGDLAGILTNLNRGSVLFIDEIHRLNTSVEEYLYSAMEDYVIDLMIDKGPHARSVRINLEKFTLIGATTRAGLLSAPLRSRFGVIERIDYYNPLDLTRIVERSSKILSIEVDQKGTEEIAKRSRGTPRIANRLLRRVRDYAQVKADGIITRDVADLALALLNIDKHGLDDMDKKILETLVLKFGGGPVGIKSLSVAIGEEKGTLEELYEPYLIQEGYLIRTLRGRAATELTYKVLGLSEKSLQTGPQIDMFKSEP